MAGIKLTGNIVDYAIKKGKNIISVPMADKSSAKVLWDNKRIDIVNIKHGSLKGVKSMKFSVENMAVVIEKLQKFAEKGVDVMKLWSEELIKNISRL